jgi:hypothetical protein
LLLALVSSVILGFRPHGTHDHIFLSHDSDPLSGKLLLALVSSVILGFRPHGTHDYNFGMNHIENSVSSSFGIVVCIFVQQECVYQAVA